MGLIRFLFLIEDHLVRSLLKSQNFHSVVQRIHHRIEHGKPLPRLKETPKSKEEKDLDRLYEDQPEGFLQHFVKEIRNQVSDLGKKK